MVSKNATTSRNQNVIPRPAEMGFHCVLVIDNKGISPSGKTTVLFSDEGKPTPWGPEKEAGRHRL